MSHTTLEQRIVERQQILNRLKKEQKEQQVARCEQRIARRQQILDYLKKHGSQREFELSKALQIPATTLQGNLGILLRQNLVSFEVFGHGFRRWSAVK